MGWHDTSRHPLHVLRFPSTYAYADLDRELAAFRDHYLAMVKARPTDRCALLVDLSRVERSEARNRRRIAQAMDELGTVMKHRCVGLGYYVEQPLIRGALTAVMWLRSAPWPVRVFGNDVEAETWLRELLTRAGK